MNRLFRIKLASGIFVLFSMGAQLHAKGPTTRAFLIYDTPLYRNAAREFSDVATARGLKSTVLSNITSSLNSDWDGRVAEAKEPKRDLVSSLSKVLKAQLKSGEMVKGDQVLIQIMTHGAERSPGEATHSIEVGGQAVSIDSLKAVVDDLTRAGIRVGIIDGSCYSGATLALKSKDVCIISSQVASRTAAEDSRKNGTFVDFFWGEIKKLDAEQPVSLEKAFLDARSKRNLLPVPYTWRFDRPQLSSSEAEEKLDPIFDAFDTFRLGEARNAHCSGNNSTQKISALKESCAEMIQNLDSELPEKLRKFGRARLELAKLDELLDPILGHKNAKTEELYLRSRKLRAEADLLETEVYKLEAQFYQKYHTEQETKVADPCRNFKI